MALEEIFVSVVAREDSQLVDTLKEALAKAEHPERVVFGLCLQYETRPDLSFLGDNHKVIFQDSRTIYGVGLSRKLVTMMLGDEKYFLQIDAHTSFDYGWDTLNIENLQRLISFSGNNKVVLSKYLETSKAFGDYWRYHYDNEVDSINYSSAENDYVKTDVAAGMYLFSDSRYVASLDYPHVFFHGGEEYALGMQTYCLGYDIYAPRDSYCYHSPETGNANRDYREKIKANPRRSPKIYDDTVSTRQTLKTLASRGFIYNSLGRVAIDFRGMERSFADYASKIPPR